MEQLLHVSPGLELYLPAVQLSHSLSGSLELSFPAAQFFVDELLRHISDATSTFLCLNLCLDELRILQTQKWKLENEDYTSLHDLVDTIIRKLETLYEKHPKYSSSSRPSVVKHAILFLSERVCLFCFCNDSYFFT